MRLTHKSWFTSLAYSLAFAGALTACGDSADDTSDVTDATSGTDTADTTDTSGTTETGDTSDDATSDALSIAEIASGDESFSTLVAALEAADLVDTFAGEGTFTVFAPNNDAFAALPEGALDALLADKDALTEVLTYHVLGSTVMSTDLASGKNFAATLQGANAVVNVGDAGVTVNKANVYAADIEASNGVIHAIDSIILPPSTLADLIYTSADHTILMAALDAAELTPALAAEGAKTVFAPTDDAFAALPEGTVEALLADIPTLSSILLTHVIDAEIPSSAITSDRVWVTTLSGAGLAVEGGEGVTVFGENAAAVSTADLGSTNGVIHVVDSVILPPVSIAGIARSLESFSVLTGALEATGLYDALADLEGQFTVFAPDNAAFQPLIDNGTIESLTVEQLSSVLLYHVINGAVVMSSDISSSVSVATMQGDNVTVAPIAGGGVSVSSDISVSVADLSAGNGVIHVVDGVLLPPAN